MLTIDTDQGPATQVEAGSRPEEADVALAARLAGGRRHPAMRALSTLSDVADQPPLFALCGAVLAYGLLAEDRRAARAGARMLGAFLAATAAKAVLKRVVTRTRPHVLLDEGRYEVGALGPGGGPLHSFPSGHTAGGVAVARALGRVYPGARTAAYAGAAAAALVQIPRGAHYPADVAAGALVGLAAEALVDRGIERFARFLAASVPRARPEADGAGVARGRREGPAPPANPRRPPPPPAP